MERTFYLYGQHIKTWGGKTEARYATSLQIVRGINTPFKTIHYPFLLIISRYKTHHWQGTPTCTFSCLVPQHFTEQETVVSRAVISISSFLQARSFPSLTDLKYLVFKSWLGKFEIKNLPFGCSAIQLSTSKGNV